LRFFFLEFFLLLRFERLILNNSQSSTIFNSTHKLWYLEKSSIPLETVSILGVKVVYKGMRTSGFNRPVDAPLADPSCMKNRK